MSRVYDKLTAPLLWRGDWGEAMEVQICHTPHKLEL